jgi:putative two-component system response regulator
MPGKVLAVDDDAEMVKLMLLILQKRGYECTGATSGQQAVELVLSSSPDVVLLDDMMPDMTGHEVCRRLRADPATQDIPIIMCTARRDTDEYKAICFDLGANSLLLKPFTPDSLVSAIREFLPD